MNIPNDALVKTVPAAAQLRNVKGFNPAKFLRQTVSEQTKKLVYRLDLPYKRAWFRIACPNGRMILRPLRITEELAIIEAQVYLSKDDPQPLSSVISQVDRAEAKKASTLKRHRTRRSTKRWTTLASASSSATSSRIPDAHSTARSFPSSRSRPLRTQLRIRRWRLCPFP